MDTKQILRKTGSLIWRYRVLCLLGALLATGVVLVAAKDARLTGAYRLEELARIKDDMFPADARLAKAYRLEQLARIKDDVFPADARLAKAYRLEELARIKDDVFPANPHLTQPSTQAYLTANPELAMARRYASMKILAEAAQLAANPELMLARRFAQDNEMIKEWEYLAANPELSLARRYTAEQSKK